MEYSLDILNSIYKEYEDKKHKALDQEPKDWDTIVECESKMGDLQTAISILCEYQNNNY
jgi:hypothetical protein